MSKPVVFLVLVALAILAAGLFGALHNQLSYSVGASYFHDLKFAQFGISETMQNRLGAASVGWQASWWMGLVVGTPAFALGLVAIRHPTRYLLAGMSAMAAVVCVVLLFAMGGLVLGMIAPGFAHQLPLPDGVTDTESFLRAALMHEAAYYGGFAGILVALWAVWQGRRAERMAFEEETGE